MRDLLQMNKIVCIHVIIYTGFHPDYYYYYYY